MALRPVFKTPAGYVPTEGNREMPDPLDFTAVTSIDADLSNEQRMGGMDLIQSVFIDNTQNAVGVTIQFQYGLLQRIVCPALSQGIFPVLVPGAVKYRATSTGGVIIPVIWSNMQREFAVWGPVTVNGSFVASTGAFTGAGLSTAGGVSEQLLAANALRKGYLIAAKSSNAESVWINWGAAAAADQSSYELMPGGVLPSTFVLSLQAINAFSVSAGMKVTAKDIA